MRKRRRLIAAVVAVSLCATTTFAQDADASGDRKKQIDALIQQLSSPDPAVRNEATRKLVEMGPDAQAALKAFVEARSAAESALAMIESNQIASATPVTIELKDATPREALEALAEKTGFRLEAYNESSWDNANLPTITLSATDVPFWDVMLDMMKQGEFSIYQGGDSEAMQFMPQRNIGGPSLVSLPRSDHGSFVVLAQSLQRQSSLQLSDPQNISRSLSLQLVVLAEPKVNVLRYTYQPQLEEAVDDKGNSLAPQRHGSSFGSSGSRQFMWNINVPLQQPENGGSTLKSLRGSFKVTVQTRSESVDVPDIMTTEPVTRKVGDLTITVHPAQRQDDRRFEVKLVVERGPNMDQQSFYNMLNQVRGIQLLDADGNTYRYSGRNSSTSGDRAEMTARFYTRGNNDSIGEPARLVWEIPVNVQDIDVPFTFTDLPLP